MQSADEPAFHPIIAAHASDRVGAKSSRELIVFPFSGELFRYDTEREGYAIDSTGAGVHVDTRRGFDRCQVQDVGTTEKGNLLASNVQSSELI